jgi:lipid II:glycine glycyltransferase (peptidoglycan interpeptide bridge formation enzyme)
MKIIEPEINITIKICKSSINDVWDNFVSMLPDASHEQTSRWANVCIENEYCHSHLRIIIFDKTEIIGGTQVLIRRYGKFGKIGIINQGPCFISERVLPIIINQIKQLVKTEGLNYITIDVNYGLSHLPHLLLSNGFKKSLKNIPPQPLVESTLILNLDQTLDELFSQLDSRRKRNIKSGLKFNFQTKTGTRDDIPMFLNLMNSACQRRNAQPLISDVENLYSIWDSLAPKGWVMLHVAEVNNSPVCAAFCYTFGGVFRYDLWGWNGEYDQQKITETFLWKNIIWAKENGFKQYDSVQIDPIAAKAIQSGELIPEDIKTRELFGATYFKIRWGGKVIYYPGLYSFYKNAMTRLIVQLISISLPKYSTMQKIRNILKFKLSF